ncbi:MAG TPA: histidine kinase, partial [Clostridiales bacterium]|nr:histidine kinase [Clostridiales bacterium]
MEKFHSYPAKDYVTVTHFAGSKDFPVMQPDSIALQKEMSAIEQRAPMPSESEIKEILLQMGK